MITAESPAFDSAKLIRTLYRFNHARLATMTGLTSARTVPALREHPGVVSGLCPLASNGFLAPDAKRSLVVGGGCLGYSNAELHQLRLDYLTDTMLALAYAAWAQLPCLIYLPIGEEIITAGQAQRTLWSRFGDQIEPIVRRLAAKFDIGQPIFLLRTDETRVRDILDHTALRHAACLPDKAISVLYSLRPSGKTVTPSEARLSQYRSTIATYLPEVVRELTANADIAHVIASESLHQVKAINQARQLASRAGDCVDHFAHVPAPSLGGTTRMATATPDNSILAAASPADSAARVHRASVGVQSYWHAVWAVHRSISATTFPPTIGHFMATYQALLNLETTP